MLKFRIDSQEFSQFLSFVHLDGLVYDTVISVKNGKLTAQGLDISKAIYYEIVKETKVLNSGELIIGNIGIFNKILSRFDGVVQVEADKKVIIIRRKHKAGKFEVAEKKSIDSFVNPGTIKFIKNKVVTPKLKLTFKSSKFALDASDLSGVVADADILDEHIYFIEVKKNGEITFKVKKGRNVFRTHLKPEKSKINKDITQKFGHGIKEIFKTIEGEVKIFLEPKPPMLIKFGPKYQSLYLVMTRED
jgi:hypothetical protein